MTPMPRISDEELQDCAASRYALAGLAELKTQAAAGRHLDDIERDAVSVLDYCNEERRLARIAGRSAPALVAVAAELQDALSWYTLERRAAAAAQAFAFPAGCFIPSWPAFLISVDVQRDRPGLAHRVVEDVPLDDSVPPTLTTAEAYRVLATYSRSLTGFADDSLAAPAVHELTPTEAVAALPDGRWWVLRYDAHDGVTAEWLVVVHWAPSDDGAPCLQVAEHAIPEVVRHG